MASPICATNRYMDRDGFLERYRNSIWEGGARYWRGRVMYRPTWAVRDIVLRGPSGYWVGNPPLVWLVELERLDDNSATHPRGSREFMALQCFEPWENFPGGALLRRLEGVRAHGVA